MWIVAVVLAAFLVVSVWLFNRIIAMRRLTENAWSDVDVYLKRRADLIPNLVETVKGAATYERDTFEGLVEARSAALRSPGPSTERAAAESEVGVGLARAVAVAEAYPDLKVSQNFLKLQSDLSEAERHIADARQYYNACVRDFNTMIETFPGSLLAAMGGFRPKAFFEVESALDRETPTVKDLS